MKKTMVISAVAVVLCMVTTVFADWPAIQWTISYDGSVLPTASGAILFGGTPYTRFGRDYADSTVYETDGDIFEMSTIGSNGGADVMWAFTTAIPSEFNFNSTTGYTVEARMMINNATALYSGASTLFFKESDKAAYWALGVAMDPGTSQQYVALSSDTTTYVAVTPGWHIYRVTATNDNNVRLYIDGSTTAAATRAMYSDSSDAQWGFGDLTGGPDADWELDYVAIDNTGAIIGCNGGIIPGDVNGDCYVNFKDFALMASHWLKCNDLNNAACL